MNYELDTEYIELLKLPVKERYEGIIEAILRIERQGGPRDAMVLILEMLLDTTQIKEV